MADSITLNVGDIFSAEWPTEESSASVTLRVDSVQTDPIVVIFGTSQ